MIKLIVAAIMLVVGVQAYAQTASSSFSVSLTVRESFDVIFVDQRTDGSATLIVVTNAKSRVINGQVFNFAKPGQYVIDVRQFDQNASYASQIVKP